MYRTTAERLIYGHTLRGYRPSLTEIETRLDEWGDPLPTDLGLRPRVHGGHLHEVKVRERRPTDDLKRLRMRRVEVKQ